MLGTGEAVTDTVGTAAEVTKEAVSALCLLLLMEDKHSTV